MPLFAEDTGKLCVDKRCDVDSDSDDDNGTQKKRQRKTLRRSEATKTNAVASSEPVLFNEQLQTGKLPQSFSAAVPLCLNITEFLKVNSQKYLSKKGLVVTILL